MGGFIWLIIGIIVAVCVFLFFPGGFDFLVSAVQWVIHSISNLIGG